MVSGSAYWEKMNDRVVPYYRPVARRLCQTIAYGTMKEGTAMVSHLTASLIILNSIFLTAPAPAMADWEIGIGG